MGTASLSDALLFEQSLIKNADEAFEDFKQDLNDFLTSRVPNRYVYGNNVITVYVRKGHHLIGGVVIKCLDCAMLVIREPYRNRGLGMRVVNHIHSINPFCCTYVESIVNNQLYDRLKRNGWIDVSSASSDRNVFKVTPLLTFDIQG